MDFAVFARSDRLKVEQRCSRVRPFAVCNRNGIRDGLDGNGIVNVREITPIDVKPWFFAIGNLHESPVSKASCQGFGAQPLEVGN